MGLLGWFRDRKARREEEERAYWEEQERLQREQERASKKPSGPPDDVSIKTEVVYTETEIIYSIMFKNLSQDPMGDIDVAIIVDKKLGIPIDKVKNIEMLDPDDTASVEFRIVPILNLGKGTIKAQVQFFDFVEQDRVSFNLKTKSIQINLPKITPMRTDEDLWRVKMSNLAKFEYESREIEVEPALLFEDLGATVEEIGFYAIDPFIVPTLYRGIGKFIGTVGDDIYACQIQVIGQEDISKVLIECYGPNNQKAIGLCARILTPLDSMYHLKRYISSELPEGALDRIIETGTTEKFDRSEIKMLGKDGKPLAEDEEEPETWEAQEENDGPPPQGKAEEPPEKEAPLPDGPVVRKLRIVAD